MKSTALPPEVGKNDSNLQNGTEIPTSQKSSDFPDPLIFTREDWTEFRDIDRISAKAGVSVENLPRVVVKELVDNALDAADDADYGILSAVNGEFRFFVADNGPGLPGNDQELAEHFSIRRPLTSSKTRRMPTRGMLGNGLRVVVGVVHVADGELRVCARGRALTLKPRADGSTDIIKSESWDGSGTRIEVTFRKEMAEYARQLTTSDDDLFGYARVALDLSKSHIYAGNPSPWWYSYHSFWELLQAAGDRPIERIVADLDGCTSRSKISKIVGNLKGEQCCHISADQAKAILNAARREARAVTPKRLGKIGKLNTYVSYAKKDGAFDRGEATIPFVVEVWVNRDSEPNLTLCVNRTPVVNNPSMWRYQTGVDYVLNNCGFDFDFFKVGQKRGGDFHILVNIITPFVPLTSSGKDPDASPMADQIIEAIESSVKRAKRALPRRNPSHSQKEIILKNLSAAVAKLSGNGQHLFSLRQLFYHLRPYLIRAIGKEPRYGTFSKIIGKYEDENGDIESLYRDDRGTLYHPHTGESIPLGTRSMSAYDRPKWSFNKILYCEKEGLFPILQHAKWPERHDCALLTSKGYATRAAREALKLIQQSGEPIQFFCIHDADGDGTMIFQTLQAALKNSNVDVINLGLDPSEARAMNLEVETFKREKEVRVADYIPTADRRWLQTNRIELNAMTTPQFLEWLTKKISAFDKGKVIPPTEVMLERMNSEVRAVVEAQITDRILREANIQQQVDNIVRERQSTISAALAELQANLPDMLKKRSDLHWTELVRERAESVA